MGKKSGKACTADEPEAPEEALEADVADPGQMEEIKAEQEKTQTGKYGSTKVEKLSAAEETTEEETHWIALLLTDTEGNPMPNEPYQLKLPDGRIVKGRLDNEGKARHDGIQEGNCEVCYPDIDENDWNSV